METKADRRLMTSLRIFSRKAAFLLFCLTTDVLMQKKWLQNNNEIFSHVQINWTWKLLKPTWYELIWCDRPNVIPAEFFIRYHFSWSNSDFKLSAPQLTHYEWSFTYLQVQCSIFLLFICIKRCRCMLRCWMLH